VFQTRRERNKAAPFCLTCENLREFWEDESARYFAGDWLAERMGFELPVSFSFLTPRKVVTNSTVMPRFACQRKRTDKVYEDSERDGEQTRP
jgi:hypothetical protein